MAFGGKGGKAGGKTRKIRPSSGDLCSFRYVAGRSVQDCGKVVQKLAGREDEKYKLCTTLCAPLRHGTRIVQVSFPRCVRCVGVVVRRCAIRSFSLPPAEAGCPFRRRGRGGRQGKCGLLCEGASVFGFALPHPAHGGAGHGGTTARTLFRSGADTPRERPTGERYIIYTSALSTPSNRGHGAERRPCEHPSPAKTSAPAPSAFIFPRPRSHFPRMAFGLPLNDVRPCRPVVHTSPAYPSAAPTKTLASRSSSYPQWVIHGKVIHIVARRPVQNVLALAPAHAYI